VQSQTAGLMAAVSSLPQLRERKRIIDKHTNMLTAILDQIKERGLDHFYHLEEDCLSRKATLPQIADAVQVCMLAWHNLIEPQQQRCAVCNSSPRTSWHARKCPGSLCVAQGCLTLWASCSTAGMLALERWQQ
jgi:Sec1 family